MNRKTAIKIIMVAAGFVVLGIMILGTGWITASVESGKAVLENSSLIIILFLAFCIVMLIVYLVVKRKYEWWSIKPILDRRKEKIYKVPEMMESSRKFITNELFGVEDISVLNNGHTLSLKGAFHNSPTSDTPFSFFLYSTKPFDGIMKDKDFEIPDHHKHFVFVDRRTNECTYNPNIDTIGEALEFMELLRKHAMPIELSESAKNPIGKALEKQIQEGYARKVGEGLVGKQEQPQQNGGEPS